MTAPDPTRQKAAREVIEKIFADAQNVWVIHYSCESFHDRPEGRSPRITSIALRRLSDAQTSSFSIHKIAELKRVPFNKIEDEYDCLEKEMLQQFYNHLKKFQQAQYLHWNMRDANYGFQAIEHRFRVLGGTDTEFHLVDDKSKTDLARLIIDIYGTAYIGHPRLEKLIERNKISPLDFMPGEKEAEAFDKKDFVALHQSTLRKVDIIANIAVRAKDRSLKTNVTWWKMHGGRVASACNWVAEHPMWVIGTGLATIIGVVIAVACG